ncbi:hypothetical protein ACE1B6_01400 [Aerosakkonemataceae cyanobacterium BLCC-F154]|uniref:Uncharacterized protein n=1 Tax=Floridaenema fluviatile BLCC-F154 TaxID=3153640 RepID=A0ABV4Y517_9CYAN
MSQPNPLELAKQGHPKAIESLINRQMQPKGITAKVALKNNCLHIMLEAAQDPLQKFLILLTIIVSNFLTGFCFVKVIFKSLFLLTVLLISLFLSFPPLAWADLTNISVEIENTKANTKSWDTLNGAPDIAICLTNKMVGTMCLPEGDSISNIRTAQCQNSFKCKFNADVPEGNFKISVVDVDPGVNDLIGTSLCHTGTTCEIGQAKVTIGK